MKSLPYKIIHNDGKYFKFSKGVLNEKQIQNNFKIALCYQHGFFFINAII